jgi:hypothetical protein
MTAAQPEYPYPWQFTKIIKTIETSANQMRPFTYQSTAYRHVKNKQSAGYWHTKIKTETTDHQRGEDLYQDSSSSKTPAGYQES